MLRTAAQWLGFWLLWSLVSFSGLFVDRILFRGTLVAQSIITLMESWIGTQGSQIRVFEVLTSGLLGLIDGLLLGLFQWIAIKRKLIGARIWILATALGLAVGLILFWSLIILFVPDRSLLGGVVDWGFGMGLLDSILSGTTLGFAQWLVLRKKVTKAEWWVAVTIVGMVAAWLVRWFINPVISFIVLGAISGLVLTFLLFREEKTGEQAFTPTDFPMPLSRFDP
jgi:hypothetical protein